MAKIRLVRGVLSATGHIDPSLWRAQMAMGLPVGLCTCGGSADGDPIDADVEVADRGRLAWANARCGACGTEASRPVVAKAAPLPA